MDLNLKDLHDYVSRRHLKTIISETKALQPILNISYFAYQKVTADGNFSVICNNPSFFDFYLENKFYLDDPYLVKPLNYKEGKDFHFISPHRPHLEEGLAKIFAKTEKKFRFSEFTIIANKNSDYYELFVFSSQSQEKTLMPFYLNQMDLLDRFTTNFKKNNYRLLNELDEVNINIAEVRGDNFHSNYPNYQIMSPDLRENFLATYSPEECLLKNRLATLTNRERECLAWVIKGKTIAETAEILSISKRTVELHRQRYREKLGSHYTFNNLCYLLGKYNLL